MDSGGTQHPFLAHLIALLSLYELGPLSHSPPIPKYHGPSDWQTDSILRSLGAMARRIYTAEEAYSDLKAQCNSGPEPKKRRSVGSDAATSTTTSSATTPTSTASTTACSSSYSNSAHYSSLNGGSGRRASSASSSTFFTPPPTSSGGGDKDSPGSFSSNGYIHHHSKSLTSEDVDMDSNTDSSSSDGDQRPSTFRQPSDLTPQSHLPPPSHHIQSHSDPTSASTSPMTISLQGIANPLQQLQQQQQQYIPNTSRSKLPPGTGGPQSAPPSSHADTICCPSCGRTLTSSSTLTKLAELQGQVPIATSPLVVPPGPLAAAAFESGMSAVEELRLLKDQVQDVANVCNAVARGDLSKKITVPVQGVVMVQLKEVINAMVDKLGQFAKEVTRVSQEVGTEGKLGGQALVLDVEGTWRELTGVVNSLAANLTNQVRSIAKVTKAVAQGDLSKQIDVDAQGEILELKNTVNEMVVKLRVLAAEVTRVTLEVGSKGVLGGQAHVPDVEGVWLELTRNVSYPPHPIFFSEY